MAGAAPGSRLTLLDDGRPIGEAWSDSSGRARFEAVDLRPGDHSSAGRRVGHRASAVANALTVRGVHGEAKGKGTTPTAVALTSSANPSFFGEPLTLRAQVTPAGTTGSVTFYDGVTVLGTAQPHRRAMRAWPP